MKDHRVAEGALRQVARCARWIVLGLLLAVPVCGKERVTLQKGVSDAQAHAQNAYVQKDAPTTPHPAALQVQSRNNFMRRAYIEFDLSLIPRSGIKAATLTLNVISGPGVTGRTYDVFRITGLWLESQVTWNDRITGTAWGAAGGDFNATILAQFSPPTASPSTMQWTLTSAMQSYFGQGTTPPNPNYGLVIQDDKENAAQTINVAYSSQDDPTASARPALQVDFVQQVKGVIATAGNNQVTIQWTVPNAIGTVIDAANGVLIVRRAGSPVPDNWSPADGTTPAACSTVTSNGVTLPVVFVGTGTLVSGSTFNFTDTNTNCSGSNALANGTMMFYKIFARDAANAYSANGTANGSDSSFVPLAMAMPNTTAATQQQAAWIAPVGTATMAAPGIDPGVLAVVASNSALVQFFDPTTGNDVLGPVSVGGAVGTTARPPVIEAQDTDVSLGSPVTFVPAQDNFVYGVDTETGDIFWLTNPTGLATNAFVGGASILLKNFAPPSFTLGNDLVVVGTNNTGSATANHILGINAPAGNVAWQVIGATTTAPAGGCAAGVAACNMDIVVGTPLVDYNHNYIWVTSHNGATNAASPSNRPNVWKIEPSAGTILSVRNIGSDISSSPTISQNGDTLFVGTDRNSGTPGPSLAALDSDTPGAVPIPLLGSYTPATGAGATKGFPVLMTFSSPYVIVFARNATLHKVNFDRTSNTFSGGVNLSIGGACTTLSTPIGFGGLRDATNSFDVFYVGCNDGKLYEVRMDTFVVNKSRNVAASGTQVGDPTLDVVVNKVLVGAGGKVYAFTIPF